MQPLLTFLSNYTTTNSSSTGVPKVGLTQEDLELLANPSDVNRIGRSVLKASRRDIGYAMATKAIAATTVSGTMILAHAAGNQLNFNCSKQGYGVRIIDTSICAVIIKCIASSMPYFSLKYYHDLSLCCWYRDCCDMSVEASLSSPTASLL